MLSAALGLSIFLSSYGPVPAAAPVLVGGPVEAPAAAVDAGPDRITVWWRTDGAEVVESHTAPEGAACSLMLRSGDVLAVLMSPAAGSSTLFVRDPAWNFGDRQRSVTVSLGLDGSATALSGEAYHDWVRAPVADDTAAVLPLATSMQVSVPDSQGGPAAVTLDQSRMNKVRQQLGKCQAVVGRAG